MGKQCCYHYDFHMGSFGTLGVAAKKVGAKQANIVTSC